MSLPYQLQCCTLNIFSLYGNWITGHNIMITGAALIVERLAHALPWHHTHFSIGLEISTNISICWASKAAEAML